MGSLYFSPLGGLTLKYFWFSFSSRMISTWREPFNPPIKLATLSYLTWKCTICLFISLLLYHNFFHMVWVYKNNSDISNTSFILYVCFVTPTHLYAILQQCFGAGWRDLFLHQVTVQCLLYRCIIYLFIWITSSIGGVFGVGSLECGFALPHVPHLLQQQITTSAQMYIINNTDKALQINVYT